MLRIRLRRVGAKRQPSYRIVVAESTSPRDGRFVEVIGVFNSRTEPESVVIQEERALYWLSKGARPSDAVARLLKNNGSLARLERLNAGESMADLVSEVSAKVVSKVEAVSETKPVDAVAADVEAEDRHHRN